MLFDFLTDLLSDFLTSENQTPQTMNFRVVGSSVGFVEHLLWKKLALKPGTSKPINLNQPALVDDRAGGFVRFRDCDGTLSEVQFRDRGLGVWGAESRDLMLTHLLVRPLVLSFLPAMALPSAPNRGPKVSTSHPVALTPDVREVPPPFSPEPRYPNSYITSPFPP